LEIIVTKSAGFCFGVKRAVDLAYKVMKEGGGRISTLGPIIHNPQEVKKLQEVGVAAIENVADIDSGTIILRSHGVSRQEMEELKFRKVRIIDATCPFVKRSQDFIRKLTRDGYFIIVLGDKDHPEVKSILSHASGQVLTVNSAKDLDGIKLPKKVGIVAQTTQPFENLSNIVVAILDKTVEVRIFNTICNATTLRQKQSAELSSGVDCVLVIGGRNSSNTNKLFRICKDINPRTYHIEEASEIDPEWFRDVKRVGVTAGASTPKWVIEDVVKYLKKINKTYYIDWILKPMKAGKTI
jgi:4-hydroxy-3-methylbut-2-enyl diphosphate reductase